MTTTAHTAIRRGKAHELSIAKRLGCKRTGATGRNTSDTTHPLLAVECKSRKDLPGWLKDAISQAVRNALPGQTPLVILHELGARHDGDVVCMRLADFEDLHGRLTPAEATS